MEKMTQFMTPEETAQLLKVHTETIYRMIRKGDLPAYRVGKNLRIDRSDLKTLLVGEVKGIVSIHNAVHKRGDY